MVFPQPPTPAASSSQPAIAPVPPSTQSTSSQTQNRYATDHRSAGGNPCAVHSLKPFAPRCLSSPAHSYPTAERSVPPDAGPPKSPPRAWLEWGQDQTAHSLSAKASSSAAPDQAAQSSR